MKAKLVTSLLLLSNLIFSQSQIGTDIDGENPNDQSGSSISLNANGNIVAIASQQNNGINGIKSGHVRIYKNIAGNWSQIGSDIDGEAADDYSGDSVSLNSEGNIVAIGSSRNTGINGTKSGHVRIYKNIAGNWTQLGSDIDGEAADDWSGFSTSLNANGDIVAIGAIKNNGSNGASGHVRIYKNITGNWTQIGTDINGEAAGDNFGFAIHLNANGNMIAIGAINNQGSLGLNSGHVRVYKNNNNVWTQVGTDIDGEAAGDFSGYSVNLSANGNILAVGAVYNHGINGASSGHVRIYKNIGNVWTQIGNDIDGEASIDQSGRSVSLSADGSIVAIGAGRNHGINGIYSGHVRVYKNSNDSWVQIGNDIDGEGSSDIFGQSVDLSANGSILAIGARGNDNMNGTESGHARVFDLSSALSIEQNELQETLRISPNPSNGFTKIYLEKARSKITIQIVDALGKMVYEKHHTNANAIIINTYDFPSGIYFVNVLSKTYTAKVKLVVN